MEQEYVYLNIIVLESIKKSKECLCLRINYSNYGMKNGHFVKKSY